MRRGPTKIALAAVVLSTAAGASAHDTATDDGRDPAAVPDRAGAPPPSKEIRPEKKWFWVDGGVGVHRIDLTTFRARRSADGDSLTADLVPNDALGPSANLGFGVRLYALNLGVRASASHFQDSSAARTVGSMQLYSVDAELAIALLPGRVQPYLLVGGGYSAFGGLDDAVRGLGRGLDVDGANLRVGAGLDYYVTATWSLGARVTGEALFLSRPGMSLRELASPQQVSTVGEAKARILEGDGSSVGTAVSILIGPGVHF